MRVLITSRRGAGHFGPLVPFAEAFRRAGDDVLVAAPHVARSMVEGAGLPFWGFDDPPPEREAVYSSLDGLTADQKNAMVLGEVFTRLDARAPLPGVLAACAEWQPHVVLRETCEFAGYLAAERRSIPHARVGIGLGSSEDFVSDIVTGVLADLRAELGLSADPTGERLRRAPFFTLTPRGMEDPEAPGPPRALRFRELGPGTPNGLAAEWAPGDGRPLVYVTFGSVAPTMDLFPDLYRAAIDALADLPARVLVTVGRDRDPADLAPLPGNVRAEGWVPQRHVMPHAAAMVCHGGFGTVRMALASGVPMVVLPLFADQPYNARRVAELGAGIALERGPAGVAELAEAVEVLLDDSSYRTAAARVEAEVRTLPPVDGAPYVLRGLLAA
jgi:UDP:flavonoid glycosyltransferase YjiC (YdhE family)